MAEIVGYKGQHCDNVFIRGLRAHTATEANFGRTYIFGGEVGSLDWSGEFDMSNEMMRYDDYGMTTVPKREEWPPPIAGHSACRHNNSLYVVGGRHPDGPNPDVWVFSCETERFRKMARPAPEITPWPAVSGGGKLFLIGGKSIWALDLEEEEEGEWRKLADRPDPTSRIASAQWMCGSIYMVEEDRLDPHRFEVRKHDVATGEFVRLQPMEDVVFMAGSMIGGGTNLMLALGRKKEDGEKTMRLMMLFDDQPGWGWHDSPPSGSMPPHIRNTASTFDDDDLYIFGGMEEEDLPARGIWVIRMELVGNGPKKPTSLKSGGRFHALTEPTALKVLAGDFGRLLLTQQRADVEFLIGKERRPVKGHSLIVAARCKKLALLVDEAAAAESKAVELPQVEAVSTFDQVMEFLYTGCAGRDEGDGIEEEMRLFDAASYLGLSVLREQCADNLKKEVAGNVIIVERLRTAAGLGLGFARQFYAAEIARSSRYAEVEASAEFGLLDRRLVEEIRQLRLEDG